MFRSLGDLLGHSLRRHGLEQQVGATQVVERAQRIFVQEFGEEIMRYVDVKFVRGGALAVRVESSVVAQEVRLREKKVLGSLNDILPKNLQVGQLWFVN
ncbi:MAG: hypothetical protein A3F54_02445 [Candidatus Kerfeldbacteria bacterium RIFCSPHIGHO2_12_FULL_48_17]|uniref:DUF721 domain-containing protein n=1 Tax=Candidatus Kerfeldbacteria bacterium RIFCSPHIGHO2_12_FULL_48_17 TaxID=1798542 RepID=A0A1G2B7B7_9BACT|nr:MAG: hypothetical protein A3F54_02445 [Candidatus Kerfeldbacteria bacterium RIFCSPHIGHO2_12_FULL_48_17]